MTRAPLDDIQLRLVESYDDVIAFRDWRPWGTVACDVETTGLQPYGKGFDRIRLVQFGDENNGWALVPGPHDDLIQGALDLFSGRLVGHNARFDEAFLDQYGFDTGPQWDDSYIAHHLTRPLDYHGLKSAAGKMYGREARAGEKWLDTVKHKNHWDWATVPITHPAYWGYAAFDTVLTARIWNDLQPDLAAFRPQYERELTVARLMAEVSSRGMGVNMDYAQGLLDTWSHEVVLIEESLRALAIENPGSTAQVAAALANDGWEPDVLTETGKPAVNRAVLEGLDHGIAALVLRWRRLTKWRAAYVEPMLASDGHLHANISSLRASTGRMAVSDPPLQQLPRGPEVRSCLVTEPGTELWAIDFTGQEIRLLAAYAGDPEFTHEVLTGGDIHGRIAATLHGKDYTRDQRGWCKNALYAFAYGAAGARLAETAHVRPGEFERAVAVNYPAIPKFMKQVIAKGKERIETDGMAWATTTGGRRVAVSESRVYALTNALMQGSGADQMKQGLVKIHEAGLGESVRLVIHDEVLCAFPEGKGAELSAVVKGCLETTFRGVPFEAHVTGPGKCWGDLQ